MTEFYVSLFISNVASHLSPTFDNIPSKKIVPTPIEKDVSLVSRTGRDLQRYNTAGYRQVVGYVQFCQTLIFKILGLRIWGNFMIS